MRNNMTASVIRGVVTRQPTVLVEDPNYATFELQVDGGESLEIFVPSRQLIQTPNLFRYRQSLCLQGGESHIDGSFDGRSRLFRLWPEKVWAETTPNYVS